LRSSKKAAEAALVALLFSAAPGLAAESQTAVVREALTGDTVRLAGGKVLKYAGVEAPPLQSKIPLLREYGENALAFNRSLVEGKTVRIEWGAQLRDDLGRLVGYVFLEDGTPVNRRLLEEGHAKARPTPPNLRFSATFRKAEMAARREKKGLWREEPDNPYLKSEYVGNRNTKYYYFPTSPELERMPEAHLVTFRSRVEAKAAGYRPCPTCDEADYAEY
jgi:micrococcal nuclease